MYEGLFDAISEVHKPGLKHAGRDKTHTQLQRMYANISQDKVMAYIESCEVCSVKKQRIKKGIVVKPIVSKEMNSRCQVRTIPLTIWLIIDIDDTVLVPVEDVDRSKLDPPNLHALVIDVIGEVGYKLAVTSGVLKGVFSRHHFKHSPTNFLSRSDINFERVDLAVRTASRLQSFNKD